MSLLVSIPNQDAIPNSILPYSKSSICFRTILRIAGMIVSWIRSKSSNLSSYTPYLWKPGIIKDSPNGIGNRTAFRLASIFATGDTLHPHKGIFGRAAKGLDQPNNATIINDKEGSTARRSLGRPQGVFVGITQDQIAIHLQKEILGSRGIWFPHFVARRVQDDKFTKIGKANSIRSRWTGTRTVPVVEIDEIATQYFAGTRQNSLVVP